MRHRRSPHGERGLKSDAAETKARAISRSPHGERGLKYQVADLPFDVLGRSPHGERGLKSSIRGEVGKPVLSSLSSWRAWIEILPTISTRSKDFSRSPHGERGLKCCMVQHWNVCMSRSPHGERGLKLRHSGNLSDTLAASLSSWRAWIEMRSAG